jgi:predicted nuclease of predicted toxin-antitoxin system
MKILVDQNISFRLVKRILAVFPQAIHVKLIDLIDANDYRIFMSARQEGFTAILTQDEDFYNLLLEHGVPPKIIWLRTGNCSTTFLTEVILRNAVLIKTFLDDDAQDCLDNHWIAHPCLTASPQAHPPSLFPPSLAA